MEDFDVFTNEINYTKPFYHKLLKKFVNDIPTIPNGLNYQYGRKLLAEECYIENNEAECAFHFSEAVSASLRNMALHRDDQIKVASNNLHKISSYLKPIEELIESHPVSKEQENLLECFSKDIEDVESLMPLLNIIDDSPLHKRYLMFSSTNNVQNLQKILDELPREWTVVQLTVPYNPNENLKPLVEHRMEINSIYLTMFRNDFLDATNYGSLTVNIPANVTKEGERPLFMELYSLIEDNYKTIDNAQYLNNKRMIQNYWSRREDLDLRMKSVINVMENEWLGGFASLLTGKLIDSSLRDKVAKLLEDTISDWGFMRLNEKQRILLKNLICSSPALNSHQLKSGIRKILTEHGNTEEVRKILDISECPNCSKNFSVLHELCFKCLSKCFEAIHHFSLVDGIKAFSQAANTVKESDDFAALKKAKRYPVILIVDEALDIFPWESLYIINQHPVSRIENIHFLYYLFKLHEKNIIDGYFITKADVGRYIINPQKDLERMEKRMTSFVNYWCPTWKGYSGEPPSPDDYIRYLTEADIFLYCGHGDGCHFSNGGGNGTGLESAVAAAGGARAVVVLAGCGSVRLRQRPRCAPAGPHHNLHIAGSPMVVGMLWEVTDLEVDKVVSSLVSLCVPNAGATPWVAVGKARWGFGELDTNVEPQGPAMVETDLLRAISKARRCTNYIMIASSIVAKGLPIRIQRD